MSAFFAAFVAVSAASFSFARAGHVPYQGPAEVSPMSLAEHPELVGTILAARGRDFLLVDSRFAFDYSLHLENSVVRESASGTLSFYYRLTNLSERPLRIVDVDTGQFTRATSVDPIDVGYIPERDGEIAPLEADRSISHFSGVVLDFPFFDSLAPGESTPLFFIRTDATRYEEAGLTQFRSTPGLSSSGNGFVPTFSPILDGEINPIPEKPSAVPLPTGLMMGLIGGACVIVSRFWSPSSALERLGRDSGFPRGLLGQPI